MGARRVAVVADDLIWATRLRDQVAAAGAVAVPARDRSTLAAMASEVDAAVVDLTARAYDGVESVRTLAAAGCPVVAVAPHDDRELRHRAHAAGAERVFVYRALATDGVRLLTRWLESHPRAAAADRAPR